MTDTRDQFHERESQVAPPVRSGEVTPGPWHIYDSTDRYAVKILGIDPRTGNAHVASALGEANARLIAAAPDMLAALKAMLPENNRDAINLGRPTFETCEIARAAIAKAEGRS